MIKKKGRNTAITNEYTVPKYIPKRQEIEEIKLLMDNGDRVIIPKREIKDMSLKLYDRLVYVDGALRCVAAEGYFRLQIPERLSPPRDATYIVNKKTFNLNRKKYLEERLCSESCISSLILSCKIDRCLHLYGLFVAETDSDDLLLRVHDTFRGPFDGDRHTVLLPPVTKKAIRKIELGFENGESFSVDETELGEVQLKLSPQLWSEGGKFGRTVVSGSLCFTPDKHIYDRSIELYFKMRGGKKLIRRIRKRVCGNSGEKIHDVVCLTIHYDQNIFGRNLCEHLYIRDRRGEEEADRLLAHEEETGIEEYVFEGGYAMLLDKEINLTFGEDSQKFIKPQ